MEINETITDISSLITNSFIENIFNEQNYKETRIPILNKLYKYINSLYDNIDYKSIAKEIVDKKFLYEKTEINNDIMFDIHMDIINEIFNRYIENAFNIKKVFNIDEQGTNPISGHRCHGCVCFILSKDTFESYHGSMYVFNSYKLSVAFNENNLKTEYIKNIKSYNDIYDYIKNTSDEELKKQKNEIDTFNNKVKKLKEQLNILFTDLDRDYQINGQCGPLVIA